MARVPAEHCRSCGGSGWSLAAGSMRCTACDGAGRIPVPRPVSEITDHHDEEIERARAEEREACARIADSYEPRCESCPRGAGAAIRARGGAVQT